MVGEPVRRRATRLFYRRTTKPTGARGDTFEQGDRRDTSLLSRKDVLQSSNCNNNRAAIIERDVKGSVVTINRLKHYSFIKRRDYVDSKDIFARDASIVNETRQQKLFISDLVKFDIIQKAVNIKIIERSINLISKLPKIPKRAPDHEQQQQHISVEVFKSTIAELFKEVLKRIIFIISFTTTTAISRILLLIYVQPLNDFLTIRLSNSYIELSDLAHKPLSHNIWLILD
ncbi:unnamed protein product [Rotaria magnacalcarata]|uniref:Uncharacterized protein n=1 Tax=Rotaria magnacalcarata TaxID=392030 RepID=A0A816GMU1_9BILA|nr:unnamed protein product [Rotaria magnacalcarata]CAF4490391.1 unnamed protein product [Rotaria magnacalcarata]CAF4542797.1 unnamed protein product [Rotaria magnacalcarata]